MISFIKRFLGIGLEAELAELSTLGTRIETAKSKAKTKKAIEDLKIEYINKEIASLKPKDS